MAVEIKLEIAEVRERIDSLAGQAVAYYQADKNFIVDDNRQNGSGEVVVLMDLAEDGSQIRDHYRPCQRIQFADDSTVRISPDLGFQNYLEVDSPTEIRMGAGTDSKMTHDLEVTLDGDKQKLVEFNHIRQTLLAVTYLPAVKDGAIGFQSDQALLSYNSPLSAEDFAKVLPGGRFIPLDDVVAEVVDPWRTYTEYRYRGRIKGISQVDNFPKFSWRETGDHANTMVTTLSRNRDRVSGYAHPLENNPDGWMVFVEYKYGREQIGRALILTINRESIKVEDVDGVPTIRVETAVDGEKYELTIPEKRVSPEEITEENEARATNIRTDEKGRRWGMIPITAQDLVESISKGYYYDDMLNATLQAHHGKWVDSLN